jgi:hypothetical protein
VDTGAKALVTACTRLLGPARDELAAQAERAQVRAEAKGKGAHFPTAIGAIPTAMAALTAPMAPTAELAALKAELIPWRGRVSGAPLGARGSRLPLADLASPAAQALCSPAGRPDATGWAPAGRSPTTGLPRAHSHRGPSPEEAQA